MLIRKCKKRATKKLDQIIDDRIASLTDKSKCYDLFWNLKLGDKRMFKQNKIKYLVRYRVRQKIKQMQISQIQLLKYLRAFSGYGQVLFLHILLQEIELNREMLLLDLTFKDETVIPE